MTMDHLRIERLRNERRLLGHAALFRSEVATTDDDLDPEIILGDVVGEREPIRVAPHIYV